MKLNGHLLKLSVIEEDLNNGSGFSFPVPSKLRSFVGTLTFSHSGQVSILLGGDNHLGFPTEMESDSQCVALYLSNLTQDYMIYGSVPPNIISWTEPLISNLSDTIFIKTLSITDVQEQLRRRLYRPQHPQQTHPTYQGKGYPGHHGEHIY